MPCRLPRQFSHLFSKYLMCLQSWFLILSDNLEKHVYELDCCTKHIFLGLRDGELCFSGVSRELLPVMLETSLSSWSRISRQRKCRVPEWETLIHSANSLVESDCSLPKGNGSTRAAWGHWDYCRYDTLSVGLSPSAQPLSYSSILVLHIQHC